MKLPGILRPRQSKGADQFSVAQELESKSRELAELKTRFEAVLDHVENGVVLVDRQCNVLLANGKLRDIFSLSLDAGNAATLPSLLRHYQFVELWQKAMQLNSTQVLSAEVPQSKRNVRGSVFPLSGELTGHALLIFDDVTELRRLETVRKDFVSNVSHELRTPHAPERVPVIRIDLMTTISIDQKSCFEKCLTIGGCFVNQTLAHC